RRGRADNDVTAFPRELLEPVLLDLTLRVEAELTLDPDLDPQPLAVEPVLVALVEAAEALVALKDILQRAAPGGVDAERRPVRRHRPVDERPAIVAPVSVTELREGLFALPELQDLDLEGVMIRFVRERRKHASILASGSKRSRAGVDPYVRPLRKEAIGNRRNNRDLRDRGPEVRRQGDRRFLGRMVRTVPCRLTGARPDRRRAPGQGREG